MVIIYFAILGTKSEFNTSVRCRKQQQENESQKGSETSAVELIHEPTLPLCGAREYCRQCRRRNHSLNPVSCRNFKANGKSLKSKAWLQIGSSIALNIFRK